MDSNIPWSENDICWRELAVTVSGRTLLNDCNGIARAGRLLGILGPSGAGKSTLLSALAGTLSPSYGLAGRVWSDSGRVGVTEGTVAVVGQDDPFFGELTVRETLCFASQLAGQSLAAATGEAASLMQRVGLTAAAARRVDHTTKGEQRRLAVACAIAGREGDERKSVLRFPRAILADEPTTGLDAFQALRVVELLKELASSRSSVAVASLHQPRTSIWRCLEDVLVMAPGGCVVYQGSAAELPTYFSNLGHSCLEAGVNPAEFVIDLVSIDHESSSQSMKDRLRIEKLDFAWRKAGENVARTGKSLPRTVSFTRDRSSTRALLLLVKRALVQIMRDHVTNVLRLVATAGVALVFSLHFGRLDGGGLPTARSVAARICLVSFGVIAMGMLAMARSVDRFAKERAIIQRERLSRCYSGFVYLLSKAITELPLDAAAAALFATLVHRCCGLHARHDEAVLAFSLVAVACSTLGLAVGSLAPSADRAMAIGGPVMIVHMLTGVIDPAGQVGHSQGKFMQMMHSLSPIRYAIEALCVAELRDLDLARSAADAPRMGGLALVKSGNEVLRRLEIKNSFETSANWLVRLCFLHLLIAAVALANQPQVTKVED